MKNGTGILPIKVFSTTGSAEIADAVYDQLVTRINQPEVVKSYGEIEVSRGKAEVERFSNQNLQVTGENVRHCLAVVISTQTPPVNEELVELMMLMHALKDSRACDELLIFPYMPYSRSDRKNQAHISSGGVILPQIFSGVLSVNRTLLVDPHDTHIKHYFEFGGKPAADEITATHLLVDRVKRLMTEWEWHADNSVLVFADGGAATRFVDVPKLLGLNHAYIDKTRPDHTEDPQAQGVVGKVKGKHAIVFDDEILTGGTAVHDAERIIQAGATDVVMAAIHAPLMDKKVSDAEVIRRLERSPIRHFIVTDTIPCQQKLAGHEDMFTVLSVAPLLAESIKRIALGESLTALHDPGSIELYRN